MGTAIRQGMHMNKAETTRRIALIDVWRGSALLAMMTYHGAWDVAYLHILRFDPGASPLWRLYAHLIAGSFLFLVGVSLVLATREGLRWPRYLKRLAAILAAAALVSIVTRFVMPEGWVFFGILHQIALASVLALPFLRLPPLAAGLVGALVIALPAFVEWPLFASPALWWVGLAPIPTTSFDYVPLFPWTGVVLLGVAGGHLAVARGLDRRLAAWQPRGRLTRLLAFGGRHSLAVYLLHQGVIYGLLFVAASLFMPEAALDAARADCLDRCVALRQDGDGCHAYCRCMFEEIEGAGLTPALLGNRLDEAAMQRVHAMAISCTAIALPPDGRLAAPPAPGKAGD